MKNYEKFISRYIILYTDFLV